MDFEKEIKAALKKRGLDENLYKRIRVTSEDQIDEAVYDLAVDLKVDEEVKKEIDQKIQKALQTRKDNLREEVKAELMKDEDFQKEVAKTLKQEPKDENGKPEGNGELTTETVKKMISDVLSETLKPIQETMTQLSDKKKEEDRRSKVIAALKDKELSEELAKFISGETEDEISEQIEAIEQISNERLQKDFDKRIKEMGIPPHMISGKKKDAGEEVVEDVIKQRNDGIRSPESKQFKGKEILKTETD